MLVFFESVFLSLVMNFILGYFDMQCGGMRGRPRMQINVGSESEFKKMITDRVNRDHMVTVISMV